MAQQASPNCIHMREPVRAQIISRGDEEPLSDTSLLIWRKRIVRDRFPVAQGYARARGVDRGFAYGRGLRWQSPSSETRQTSGDDDIQT